MCDTSSAAELQRRPLRSLAAVRGSRSVDEAAVLPTGDFGSRRWPSSWLRNRTPDAKARPGPEHPIMARLAAANVDPEHASNSLAGLPAGAFLPADKPQYVQFGPPGPPEFRARHAPIKAVPTSYTEGLKNDQGTGNLLSSSVFVPRDFHCLFADFSADFGTVTWLQVQKPDFYFLFFCRIALLAPRRSDFSEPIIKTGLTLLSYRFFKYGSCEDDLEFTMHLQVTQVRCHSTVAGDCSGGHGERDLFIA